MAVSRCYETAACAYTRRRTTSMNLSRPRRTIVTRNIWRRRGVSPLCGRAHRLQRRKPLRGLLRPSTNCYKLTIPSPKSVNLKGLREVRRVVVYHNDNSKPPGSPHGHFSTFAMSPTRCVQNNAASMQPDCCGAARHDGTRNDVRHLPLGGARRQLPDCSALFLPGAPVGHAVLGVLSSAYLPV